MVPTGCPNTDVLADYVLGRGTEADLAGIASHVETCPACQAQLETLDGLTDTVVACLRRAVPQEAPSDASVVAEVLSRMESITSEAGSDAHDHTQEAVLPLQIGQYQLVEKLGQGGMGTVYKAFHGSLKRTVAVKLLPSHRQQSPQAIARFQREMEAVGRVDHPNIVRAYDAGEVDGRFFLAMEYVEGTTLSSLVRRLGALSVADACEVVRQAACGLEHAHRQGLVHRDVKPSNLMLTSPGVVKLLDLGLARLQVETCSDGDATASGLLLGSADYMAPEQGSHPSEADARADLYALGCTLYCLLAGRPPFDDERHRSSLAKVMAHAGEDVVPIEQLRADVPGPLRALLSRMLAKTPAERCATAAEVAEAIAPFCAESNLAGLLTKEESARPLLPTTPSTNDRNQPKSLRGSSSLRGLVAAGTSRKARRIGLGLLAIAASLYAVTWMAAPERNPEDTEATQPPTTHGETEPSSRSSLPTGWLKIVNRKTGLAIWPNSLLCVEPAGDYHKIGWQRAGQKSGRYLAIPPGAKKPLLRHAANSDSPALLWEIKPVGNGFWTITNHASRKCLEDPRTNLSDDLGQSPRREGALEQQWRFEPATEARTEGHQEKPAGVRTEARPQAKSPSVASGLASMVFAEGTDATKEEVLRLSFGPYSFAVQTYCRQDCARYYLVGRSPGYARNE